jgi:hypothetical protein
MSVTESLKHIITTINQCFVYKLGPRPSAKGYMYKISFKFCIFKGLMIGNLKITFGQER